MNHKVYGLVGYPLSHSLSPVMHNAVFKKLGLDCEYRLFEISPDKDFNKEIKHLIKDVGISGFNVTIPYKERILKFPNIKKDALVRIIKAANTVKVKDGSLKTYNTDWNGFILSLIKFRINLKNKKIVLLGAGGVGKAVFSWIMGPEIKFIKIYDKDIRKAKNLIKAWKLRCPCEVINNIEDLKIEEADILINATPVGMKENEAPIDPKILDKVHKKFFVYDLIYNPAETKLIKEAKKRGLEAHNGLWMLILQGYKSLEIWLGDIITSKKDLVLKTMEDALREKGFVAC